MATFAELMRQSGRRETLHLYFFTTATNLTVGEPYDGDDPAGTFNAQEGLQSLAEIVFDGKFGSPSDVAHASLSLRRDDYVKTGGTIMRLEEFLREGDVQNQIAQLVLKVEHNGQSATEIVFTGRTYTYKISTDTVDLTIEGRTLANDESNTSSPALTVQDSLMLYGSDEGRLPTEWRGSPVPMGYGRFNLMAKTSDPNGDLAHSMVDRYAIMAPLIGIKTPCMPVVLAAERFFRADGSSLVTKIPQSIWVVGDLHPARAAQAGGVQMTFGTLPGTPARNMLQDSLAVPKSTDEDIIYTGLFTWNDEYSRAQVFCVDRGDDQPAAELPYAGAGDWRKHETPWTGGADGQHVIPLYINLEGAAWGTEEVDRWAGAIQAIALPYQGLGSNEEAWTGFPPYNLFVNVGGLWSVPPGLASATISERIRAMLENDYLVYAQATGETNSSPVSGFLQAPSFGPNLGEVICIRACFLIQKQQSYPAKPDMADFYIGGRYHPIGPWDLILYGGMNVKAWAGPNAEVAAETVHNDGTNLHRWFATHIKRPVDFFIQLDQPAAWNPPTVQDGRGFVSTWQFTNISDRWQPFPPGTKMQEYAPDIAVQMRTADPDASNATRFEHAWFEVIFKAKVQDPAKSRRPKEASGVEVDYIEENKDTPNVGSFRHGATARRKYRWRSYSEPYSGNIRGPDPGSVGLGAVFAVGDGPVDDGSGTFTGTPGAFIENAGAMALHHYRFHLGSTGIEQGVGTFGSFKKARDDLGTDRLAYTIHQIQSVRGHMEAMFQDQRVMMCRQPSGIFSSTLRAFVDVTDPATNSPRECTAPTAD